MFIYFAVSVLCLSIACVFVDVFESLRARVANKRLRDAARADS